MPIVSSGQLSMSAINAEFGRGYGLNSYRGVRWYTPGSLTTGTFSSGQISMSDFYGKSASDPATTNSLAWGPGTYSFTIPLFRNNLAYRVWGGGGGGGSGYGNGDGAVSGYGNGAPGGDSYIGFPTPAHARAGGGGQTGGWRYRTYGAPGAGGLASGGNQLNNNGGNGSFYTAGNGGAGSQGGSNALVPNASGTDGGYPGAGGGGGQNDDYRGYWSIGGGGGGGAYVQGFYLPGQLTPGTVVTIIVGVGGAGGPTQIGGVGGNGGAGRVEINWG